MYQPNQNGYKSCLSININVCNKCGDYVYISSDENEVEKIYCKCERDNWIERKRIIHNKLFSKILDQLIEKVDRVDPDREKEQYVSLISSLISPYYHNGPCIPDSRTCESGCWKYWCGTCHGGIGGMYGACMYNKCRQGIRNCY